MGARFERGNLQPHVAPLTSPQEHVAPLKLSELLLERTRPALSPNGPVELLRVSGFFGGGGTFAFQRCNRGD